MGRPEKSLEGNGPLAVFAGGLRTLRAAADSPTYEQMARYVQFQPNTLSTAANGRRLPSLAVTLAYVRACGGDEAEWRQRWERTRDLLSAAETVQVARPGRLGPAPEGPATVVARRRKAEPEPCAEVAAADDALSFVKQMHILRYRAGGPTYRQLARRARQRGLSLPHSTLADALRGARMPRWPLVEAFVLACHADAELPDWRSAWIRIMADGVQPDPATGLYRLPSSGPQRMSGEPAAALGEPGQIGPYRIVRHLGSGGMGRVYRAEGEDGRPVALKVVHPDVARDPQFRRRFRREIGAVRAVASPHVAALIDADPEADPPWMATDFVEGPSLQQLVDGGGPLGDDALVRLAVALVEGLAGIHASGIVHRDLKPSNVLMAADGPRIVDFGVSMHSGESGLTRIGMVVGTAGYMAPEALEGERVGPAADIFALGALLAFAATGRRPFAGNGMSAVMHRTLFRDPDLAGCPAWLLPIVGRCLAKDPAARPTGTEILANLRGVRAEY